MKACAICKGIGWVCETHPDKPWDKDIGCDCGGAGEPCKCQGVQAGVNEPDVSHVLRDAPVKH